MSASRGRDGLLFLLTLAGGAGLAVSCNGPTTGGGDDGAVSLRQALTAAADEDAPELFHRDRVRLYEELAVHGAVQAGGLQAAPVATGDALLGAPLERLDGERAARAEPPILYPETRPAADGAPGLFPAQLEDALCWPAEFVFGQVHPAYPAMDCEGFGEEPLAALLERTELEVVHALAPWLHGLAAHAGFARFTVQAAPGRPYLVALDHDAKTLRLNPAGLPLILAAASNQGRHLPASGGSSIGGALPASMLTGEHNLPATDTVGDTSPPQTAEEALDRYQQYAAANPAALPATDGEGYTLPDDDALVCSCGCYNYDSEKRDVCTCHDKGCYCDSNKKGEGHSCSCAHLAADPPALEDVARNLAVMLFPLLVFGWVRSRTRD